MSKHEELLLLLTELETLVTRVREIVEELAVLYVEVMMQKQEIPES